MEGDERFEQSKKKIFLIDGSGFLYRAYYGLKPLHTPQGIPVQAVYSFCRMIKKLINQLHPASCVLIWDSTGTTVRHEIYPEYKIKRAAPPSDIFFQKDLIKEFADLIELPQIEQRGVEADDLIYSLAQDFSKQKQEVVIISSDKDLAQALNDYTTIFDPFKEVMVTVDSFQKDRHFPVKKISFYYALIGDSSDNIPGVKGIGPKGALELVTQFESLDDLYTHLDQVKKERIKTLLLEHKKDAYLSQRLFEATYYSLGRTPENCIFDENKWSRALVLFERLGFRSLAKEISDVPSAERVSILAERYNFKTITTTPELQALCQYIIQKKLVAIDTELTGLDPYSSMLLGISVCVEEGTAYYIPFGHVTDEVQICFKDVFELLAPLFSDPSIAKIMHHAKFDILALHAAGFRVENVVFDTILAANLTTQDWQSIGLKKLSVFYFDEHMLHFHEVVKQKGYKSFAQVPLAQATEYAAADAHQTFKLYALLEHELHKQHMERLYYEIEHPLLPVLVAMHEQGIFLDRAVLDKLNHEVIHDLAQIKGKIAALLGEQYVDLNLNSPLQLKKVLFEDLGLQVPKGSRKGGKVSTDVNVLQELAKIHPLPSLILTYRELTKLKNTYIDALPGFINKRTGKIHTDFSQTVVATGRLASSDPNLQNIPVRSKYHIHIRSAFKADAGYIFLSADYSQIELRVLAYLSQDRFLKNAFANNEDVHRQTASALFETPSEEITSEQRELGKRVNFSILYGSTPYGLSQDLGISFDVAKRFIAAYFKQYPDVHAWLESVIEETKKVGYVTTLWGRRRPVPAIYELNKVLYAEACRIAVNTKAQGTAAEIVKLSMIKLNKLFHEGQFDVKIILQIHDELLLMVNSAQIEQVEKIVKETMEGIAQWNVPLKVTTRRGFDWHEVTK